jgi:pyrroline-5-carboxylate reductase
MKLLSLGAGNMASALLGPIVNQFDRFTVYSPGDSSARFAKKFGAQDLDDISSYEGSPDILVLSFKPQMFEQACESFLKNFSGSLENTVVVSMLAGTPLQVISKTLRSLNVVRIMPNTPAMVGKGISLFLVGKEANSKNVESFRETLKQTGLVLSAENEEQFDQWTAITGSGPAYIFEYGRILSDILVEQGMDAPTAMKAVSQLFLGASLMMHESSVSFENLRNNVTSKKGVTFEALEVFKNFNLEEIVNKAIQANIDRSCELKAQALKKEEK